MKDPLKDAKVNFTDGSSNERAAYVIVDEGYVVQTDLSSAQMAER